MTEMVSIDVVIDEKYREPHVDIYTESRTEQVERIVYAVEHVSNEYYPPVMAKDGEKTFLISQRDVFRIRKESRQILLETEDAEHVVKSTLARLEVFLDTERFFRISQSEIINLYKVKCFDVSTYGTIEVEFDNGTKTWASRRYVKMLREKLKDMNCL